MGIHKLRELIAESYQNILTESVTYVNPHEVPQGIRTWVRDMSGGSIKSYRVDQSGKDITISQPAFTRSNEVYQFFRLTEDGDAVIAGNSITRHGWESDSPQGREEGDKKTGKVKIPSGLVLVRYCSYPPMVELYTSSDAQLFLPQKMDMNEISDKELVVLQVVKHYKSFARLGYILPIVPKNEVESVYDQLIAKNYLAKNRSITVSGRNLLLNPEIHSRLIDIQKRYNQTHQHAYYTIT